MMNKNFLGCLTPYSPDHWSLKSSRKIAVIYNEDDVIQVGKLCVLQLLLQVL